MSMAELHAVREALNELPFHNGKRQVFLGTVAKMFPGDDETTIAQKLRKIAAELQSHDLLLLQDEGELYAVQELRERPADLSWLSDGVQWAAKISTIGLEMVLPGVAGWWLGNRFGIPFLALLGLAIGVPLGLWHLILMTRGPKDSR